MPIPQVNDRIKEAPVVVLRAVFAGIGQILLTADKVRARATDQVWTPEPATASLPTDRQPAVPPRNGTARAETAAADRPAMRETPPLPGYDDLSFASLRGRLRALDAPTIEAMLAYEKGHARREPVITMFERRLAKISAG